MAFLSAAVRADLYLSPASPGRRRGVATAESHRTPLVQKLDFRTRAASCATPSFWGSLNRESPAKAGPCSLLGTLTDYHDLFRDLVDWFRDDLRGRDLHALPQLLDRGGLAFGSEREPVGNGVLPLLTILERDNHVVALDMPHRAVGDGRRADGDGLRGRERCGSEE